MTQKHLRLAAFLLACLTISLLLTACDLENFFSGGNSPSSSIILIENVVYNGNEIQILYQDGYRRTTTVEELAISFEYVTELGIFAPSVSTDTAGDPSSCTTDTESEPSLDTQGTLIGGTEITLSAYSVSVIGAPHYEYRNGIVLPATMGIHVIYTIQENGKSYKMINQEIIDYVRENIQTLQIDAMFLLSIMEWDTDESLSTEDGATFQLPITDISNGAFAELPNLEQINLPASIQTIGTCAFYNSPKLREICFAGTVAQWEAIQKAGGWNFGAADFLIRCSDGTVTCTAVSQESTTQTTE